MKLCQYLVFILTILSVTNFVYPQSDVPDDIATLPREKSEVLKNDWEVVPTLKKISLKKFKGNKKQIHHQNKDSVFYNSTADHSKPLLSNSTEDESQVVYNPKRNSVGSISGVLIINLNQKSDLENILSQYPIRKIHFEENLAVTLVKVKPGNDITKVYNDLKNDSRVKNVEIEISSKKIKVK